jgi:hypothetical protein
MAVLQQRQNKTESSDVARRCALKIGELQIKLSAIQATIAGIPELSKWSNIKASESPADSAAVINWTKEVAINRRMLDEAKAACDMRATQGYSKETVARVDSGEAIIQNGKILSDGDLVVANGKPGVIQVTGGYRPSVEIILSSNGVLQKTPVAGMTIESHGTNGSDERADIVKMLVDLDEANIEAKSEHLFARFSNDVRVALRSVIPSMWVETNDSFGRDSDWIAAPNFPLVMPKGADGEFCKSVVATQTSLVEFKPAVGWGRSYFRFIDVRNQGEESGRTVWGAVAGWMMANGKTMTLTELVGVDHGVFAGEFKTAFGLGLDGMISKSGNITEFEAAMIAWAQAAYPWITGFDVMVEALKLSPQVEKAKVALDDGSVKYDVVVDRRQMIGCHANGKMSIAIVAKFAAGALNQELSDFITTYPRVLGLSAETLSHYGDNTALVAEFNQVVYDAVGGKLDGANLDMTGSPFEDEIRAFIKTGKGAVIKLDLESHFQVDTGEKDAVMAYAAKQKISGMGLDVEGLLTQIRGVAGVASANVGMANLAKVRDKYTGSHLYKAGEYIRLLLPRGGDLNARFANRVTGLAGRAFDDRTKEFLVSLIPAKFSDGKDVADIIALARYLSIDPTPFKKG